MQLKVPRNPAHFSKLLALGSAAWLVSSLLAKLQQKQLFASHNTQKSNTQSAKKTKRRT